MIIAMTLGFILLMIDGMKYSEVMNRRQLEIPEHKKDEITKPNPEG